MKWQIYISILVFLAACAQMDKANMAEEAMIEQEVVMDETFWEYPWADEKETVSGFVDSKDKQQGTHTNGLAENQTEETFEWSEEELKNLNTTNKSNSVDEIPSEESVSYDVADAETEDGINPILIAYYKQNMEDFLDLLTIKQDKKVDKEIRAASLEALQNYFSVDLESSMKKLDGITKEKITKLHLQSLVEMNNNYNGVIVVYQGNSVYRLFFVIENTPIPNGMQRSFKITGVM